MISVREQTSSQLTHEFLFSYAQRDLADSGSDDCHILAILVNQRFRLVTQRARIL